ncbi:50S ribosomal protein L4 [Patescibacteria group bacterium]|nr:50S ribosomal protein L4 [Patescibacteria group bacterium]
MLKVDVYNHKGEKIGQEELEAKIFDIKPKEELVQKVIRAIMAAKRNPIAHTKTRSERRGGGTKPWKQKGTGRARAGSSRSPIWKKGGVTFGPRNDRNFTVKINKKERRKALFMSLSSKVSNKKLLLLDKMELKAPKTKEVTTLLENLKLDSKVLFITPEKDNNVYKSVRNIKGAKTLTASTLNVLDVVNYEYCLMPKEVLGKIQEVYLKKD